MITKSTILSWLGTDKNDLVQRMLKLIGSVIQLDYNPRIGIFKHLQDDEYDYWYCKYLPNNGRDAKVTY